MADDNNLNALAAFMVVAKEQNFTRTGKTSGCFTVSAQSNCSCSGSYNSGIGCLTNDQKSWLTEAEERLLRFQLDLR